MMTLVEIDYTNYRGERSKRKVRPIRICFCVSQWHEGEQWIMTAIDVAKLVVREFAMKDVHSWQPVTE